MNIARIRRQNERKISIIIGNPPYNAGQKNENENNKNREYADVDARIRLTYEARGVSHKAKAYDMYSRFIRWASDRIDDRGIVAFVANRSFVDKRAFDGFRKSAALEFSAIHVIDLFGDIRDAEKRGGNVFPNTIGTAIIFLIKDGSSPTEVRVAQVDSGSSEDKLSLLDSSSLHDLPGFKAADVAAGDWGSVGAAEHGHNILLVPAKLSGTAEEKSDPTIMGEASFGFVSNRDDWVVDRASDTLASKVQRYLTVYNTTVSRLPLRLENPLESYLDYEIKWTEDIRRYALQRKVLAYDAKKVRKVLYRPYNKRWHYHSPDLNWSLYRLQSSYPNTGSCNQTIYFSDRGARAPFTALATTLPAELHLAASTDGFQGISRYRYIESGERVDNITDWAFDKFVTHYSETTGVTKDAIFHYVYAVLHDPVYRETYALNLKREFPRIPFYPDFAKWAAWGEALMAMHIGYEDVEPWAVERVDTPNAKRAEGTHPKPILKSLPEQGLVRVDEDTQITGIPREAWDYRLGNRSAIDWVLDQHKEKTPRDPTIREKFNTYRFADYKESMIDLLTKVVRVSVNTVAITEAMKALDRGGWDEGAGTK